MEHLNHIKYGKWHTFINICEKLLATFNEQFHIEIQSQFTFTERTF